MGQLRRDRHREQVRGHSFGRSCGVYRLTRYAGERLAREGKLGLYETIHDSAPDIARGICNPLGTILNAAMLLRHSLGPEAEVQSIERAVEVALAAGARTRDLDASEKPLSTSETGDAVVAWL